MAEKRIVRVGAVQIAPDLDSLEGTLTRVLAALAFGRLERSKLYHEIQAPQFSFTAVDGPTPVARDGEVGDEYLDLGARLVPQFGGEGLEAVDVTRDEYEVMAVEGVAARESGAQSGRRSGDHRDGAGHARQGSG